MSGGCPNCGSQLCEAQAYSPSPAGSQNLSVNLLECKYCQKTVLPTADGECPVCRCRIQSEQDIEFTEQHHEGCGELAQRRPVGVIILGILLLVGSINAAYSLWSILSSPALFLGYAIVNFHLKLTIITFAACGLSLLFCSRLGWWLVIIVMPIYIFQSFLINAFLADAYGSPGDGIFALTYSGIWSAVYALVLFYMTRNNVRCFFGIARPKRAPQPNNKGRGDGDQHRS